jgi:hypothetical protein
MGVGPLPPVSFGARPLAIHHAPAGAIWRRIYETRHPDPLGFGPSRSRFSDPTGRAFGVVYLGSSVKVAFHEAILRDRGDARTGPVIVPIAELEAFTCAEIETAAPLKLVDLTGDGPFKMGVPSDVVSARDQSLAQIWSVAFHEHPDGVDGVYYPSRLNEERNIAVYDRSLLKLRARSTPRLIELRDPLAAIINDFELAVR